MSDTRPEKCPRCDAARLPLSKNDRESGNCLFACGTRRISERWTKGADCKNKHSPKGQHVNAGLITCAFVLSSCSTTLYSPEGKPVARLQSDVTGLAYTRTADGAVTLTADSLSNSAPVLAIGKALTPAVMAVGATAMMKAGTDTVNAIRRPVP